MLKFNKDLFGKIFIILWLVLITVIFTFQMAGHLVSMPLPKNIQMVEKSLFKNTESIAGPKIFHFIYNDCSCTNSLVRSLLKRRALKGFTEFLVIVKNNSNESGLSFTRDDVLKAGFRTFFLEAKYVEENYKIEAAPILAITDKYQKIQYLGGYFETSAAKVSKDKLIIKIFALKSLSP